MSLAPVPSNPSQMRDLLTSWRKARDWRAQTGNGTDGQPGGAEIMRNASQDGSEQALESGKVSLEGGLTSRDTEGF